MATLRKTKLLLSCFSALGVGVGFALLFAGLLSLYDTAPEAPVQATVKAMPFPENEAMLNTVTDQLAREGAALSKVEPAAGDAKP